MLDGQKLLAGSALSCGSCAIYCSCYLLECSGIHRYAVFDLCIAVAGGTRLHTVRVILEKVVDVIVEICERLPIVAAVAILLVQVLVRSKLGR